MRHRILGVFALLALTFTTSERVTAQGDGNVATVSFGIGLNTPATSPLNHHVLPLTVRIKQGGVVNFNVAGFHQIYVYDPGVRKEDIIVPGGTTPPLFINDNRDLYYQGLNPAGGPLGTPVTTNPSNASNRIESVAFFEPGTYLVICNVRPHFINGMYAYVVVTKGNDPNSNQ
jgi:plastocyanin